MTSSRTAAGVDQQERVNVYFAQTSRYWTGLYDQRDGDTRRYWLRHERALRLVDQLHLPADARALDLGAGAGMTTVALAERGFLVDAVDSVPAMIERIGEMVRQCGGDGRVNARLGDAHLLPADDGTYDVVVMLGVVPWLHDPVRAMSEVARTLKPGGFLVTSCDNPDSLLMLVEPMHNPRLETIRRTLGRFLRRLGFRKSPPHGPRPRFHRASSFDRLLAEAGMRKRAGQTYGFGPFTCFHRRLSDRLGLPLDRRLQAMADAGLPLIRSLGVGYLVLAEKPPQSSSNGGSI
jgi:SAM-dependent methyltransferase